MAQSKTRKTTINGDRGADFQGCHNFISFSFCKYSVQDDECFYYTNKYLTELAHFLTAEEVASVLASMAPQKRSYGSRSGEDGGHTCFDQKSLKYSGPRRHYVRVQHPVAGRSWQDHSSI